jgi:hypothetical protein
MKASLFTEEGRAGRGRRGFLVFFALLWLAVSFFGGRFYYQHYTKANMAILQRGYLLEYWHSLWKPYVPLSQHISTYKLLIRSVPNPKTKQDDVFLCHDDQVVPKLDEDGRIHLTKNNQLDLRLKPEYATQLKWYDWKDWEMKDKDAYELFRREIYNGQDYFELLYPSMIVGIVIFLPGMIGAGLFQRRRTKRYLKGKTVRGTREMSPKEYERLHRRDTGIGLEVLPHEGGN